MAITQVSSGTVENADIRSLVINRTAGGELTATVEYEVTRGASIEARTATWVLSAAEKTAVATSLLPGAKAAVEAAEGL
jgi:hypothetical protein